MVVPAVVHLGKQCTASKMGEGGKEEDQVQSWMKRISMTNVSKPYERRTVHEERMVVVTKSWRLGISEGYRCISSIFYLLSAAPEQPEPICGYPPLTSLPREHLLSHFTVVGHMSWKMWDAEKNIVGNVDVIARAARWAHSPPRVLNRSNSPLTTLADPG